MSDVKILYCISKTGGGLLSRLLGRGDFPDEDEAVATVKARLAEA